MLEAPALASKLRLLLAVWRSRAPQGGSELEFSLADLERLAKALQERQRRLNGQVRQTRGYLDSATGLGTPPKIRSHLSRLLHQQTSLMSQTQRDADLLAQAAKTYSLLLRQAPSWLEGTGVPQASGMQEVLARGQETLEQAQNARERCRGLVRASRQLERRDTALARRAHALKEQATRFGSSVEALARRLEALTLHPEPMPPSLQAPPELARLQQDLEKALGKAAAMELEREQFAQLQARHQKGRQALRSAWELAAHRSGKAEKNFTQARQLAMSLAMGLGRSAVAAGKAASQLEKMLGPLRPRELAGFIAKCRKRGEASHALAVKTRARLARLDQARDALIALEALPPARTVAAPFGQLVGKPRLEELSAQARELYQTQVARVLAQERRDYERQVRQASQRLEKAAQSREQLRRKLAQRQEQARLALAQMQQTQHQAQDRQERLEKARDELEQGKRLALKWREELSQAQAEAEDWRRVAGSLRKQNAQALHESQSQQQALQKDAEALQVRVEQLQEQLSSLALLTAVSTRPREDNPRALEQALSRLAVARQGLAQAGKKAALHAALILGLGSALVLASPNLPAKATLRDHTRNLASLQITAEVAAPAPAAELKVSLVPLDQPLMPLALLDDRQFTGLAAQAGLSPYTLYRSVRAAHPGCIALDLAGVERLARQSKSLAQRHPQIFDDLSTRCLPPDFCRLLAPEPPAQALLQRFTDRLYSDYRRLGYGRTQALSAVLTNRRAAQQWVSANCLPTSYSGRVRPVPAVEDMGLRDFLDRLTPYIAERSRYYLKRLGKRPPVNLESYSRDLAFDMYGAAKLFEVPLSYLLAIAHQETFYANILGDNNLSASPFQIWRPTLPRILGSMSEAGFSPPPRHIRLQNHLTLATYLAAFHLRELMIEASAPATKRRRAYVDMDKVMLRYNGSPLYAGRVAVRRAELSRFIAVGGG
ncbi:MAG: hypothetical protein KQI62_08320 [Deltaproteobacteria bacterium]|nr:hypothetical protein [Deltaproteobacteria bacterium]